ncbi:phosphoglycolate phosphatase [Aromatoleum aromaticum]|uniref:Phosphoglycolate phosphatase n=1 Tax=Aromatoleum aromaticum (strain DSM 19018 / LMG 30748 / EbN1) TaxID=76114 RepID=Q5P2H7_AROAE|nr:phosphoglycolate phosphatase [Aromatoleum aromaticum]NMG56538.1 phosphoglycolate phosphatase [Aromatoleum aromaticum]CAI08487.1 putative phosphoglycolate phosphatase [Aromatoleum aromaticum EbN1]
MNARRFPVRAVLFDLDGTLLDTIADLAEGANRMLAELGRPTRPLAEIHSFVGKGIPHLVRRCMTENARASEAEIESAVMVFRRHYSEVNGRHTTIYPGVAETLDAMRAMNLRLACVTNKAGAFTLPLLERMRLDRYFDAVVSGDTLPVKKPDPAVLHHACNLLGIASAQALMIGDSANDALAARAAGMPVLLVTYGYSEGMPVDTIECDGLLSIATGALERIEVV